MSGVTAPELEALLVDPFVGRVGSTLLMQLLGTSSAIAFDRVYPYEHRYLARLARLLDGVAGRPVPPAESGMVAVLTGARQRLDPFPFDPRSVDRDDLARRLGRHCWQALCEGLCAQSGTELRYYAEKIWWNTPETMAASGVPVKLVILMRDPRDVAASILAFDRKRGFHGFGRRDDQSEPEYLAWLSLRMKESLARSRSRADRFEHRWIRYEELVSEPERVVEELSAFLGVELDSRAAAPTPSEFERHGSSSSPGASVGRWRNDLSPVAVRILEAGLGQEIAAMGYGAGG